MAKRKEAKPAWRPRAAMVLAAGLGTRMRPLTDTVPKPLVKLAGRPLLDHVLDRIAAAGIATAIVNVHHHAEQIEAYVSARQGAPRIIVSDERAELLETGGGVAKALPLLGDGAFVLHNSDSVWIEGVGANLDRLAAAWDGARMDALLLLAPTGQSLGYSGRGDFTMDAAGVLARRAERSVAPFVFAGVSILHPRLFAGAPEGRFSLNVLFDRAIAAGRLHGVRLDGLWMHVGDPRALAEAEAAIVRGDDA